MAEGDLLHHLRLGIEVGVEVAHFSIGERGGIMSETVDRPTPTAPARAFAIRSSEDQDAPGVIAGSFTLYN